MKHPHPETLDETIDRVAARLTMVPADAALAGRIAAQLEKDSPLVWPRLVFATAAVAALVVLAVVVTEESRETSSVAVARVDEAAPSVAAPVVAPRSNAHAVAVPKPAPTRERTPRTARVQEAPAAPLAEIPQIDALPSIAALTVDALQTDSLTITAVDLAPLDMANLTVRDVDSRESPKE